MGHEEAFGSSKKAAACRWLRNVVKRGDTSDSLAKRLLPASWLSAMTGVALQQSDVGRISSAILCGGVL